METWSNLKNLNRWFSSGVEDISPAMVACEFYCRRSDCTQTEWNDCTTRLDVASETLTAQKIAQNGDRDAAIQ